MISAKSVPRAKERKLRVTMIVVASHGGGTGCGKNITLCRLSGTHHKEMRILTGVENFRVTRFAIFV
jgi:hypothetical protein